MEHLAAQDDTGACFGDLTFQQTFVVLIVEQLHVAGSAGIQPVFDRDMVEMS